MELETLLISIVSSNDQICVCGIVPSVDESAKDCVRVAGKWCTLLKIRGCAPCDPTFSRDVFPEF
jgi:hypothetical protein